MSLHSNMCYDFYSRESMLLTLKKLNKQRFESDLSSSSDIKSSKSCESVQSLDKDIHSEVINQNNQFSQQSPQLLNTFSAQN